MNLTDTYDPAGNLFGRRVMTTTDGVPSWFLYDGDQLIQERRVVTNDLIAEYAWGPTANSGPAIFYQFRLFDDVRAHWFYTSPQGGFPRYAFTDSGNLTDVFQYSSMGELVFHEGTTEVAFGWKGGWQSPGVVLPWMIGGSSGFAWFPIFGLSVSLPGITSGGRGWNLGGIASWNDPYDDPYYENASPFGDKNGRFTVVVSVLPHMHWCHDTPRNCMQRTCVSTRTYEFPCCCKSDGSGGWNRCQPGPYIAKCYMGAGPICSVTCTVTKYTLDCYCGDDYRPSSLGYSVATATAGAIGGIIGGIWGVGGLSGFLTGIGADQVDELNRDCWLGSRVGYGDDGLVGTLYQCGQVTGDTANCSSGCGIGTSPFQSDVKSVPCCDGYKPKCCRCEEVYDSGGPYHHRPSEWVDCQSCSDWKCDAKTVGLQETLRGAPPVPK